MILADLGAELARAIDGAVAAGGLPAQARVARASGTWRPPPGNPPGSYATSRPFELAALAGRRPADVAAELAAAVRAAPWVESAEPAAGGYLTITVTASALAAVAITTTSAGSSCLRGDALRGVSRTAPPLPDLAAATSWQRAWRDQAAALDGRLAEAAGATVSSSLHSERFRSARQARTADPGIADLACADPSTSGGSAAGPGRGTGNPGTGGPGTVRPGTVGPGTVGPGTVGPGTVGPGTVGPGTGGPAAADPSAPGLAATVAGLVSYAGADVVRYGLARIPADRAGEAGDEIPVSLDLASPFYAVSFAHADAASVARWAADLGLSREEPDGRLAGLLSQPPERDLLTRLSWLPERVASAARRGQPNELPRYLEELAEAWLECRESCPALPFGGRAALREEAGISARLWLADAARTALAAGLELIGIAAPPRL